MRLRNWIVAIVVLGTFANVWLYRHNLAKTEEPKPVVETTADNSGTIKDSPFFMAEAKRLGEVAIRLTRSQIVIFDNKPYCVMAPAFDGSGVVIQRGDEPKATILRYDGENLPERMGEIYNDGTIGWWVLFGPTLIDYKHPAEKAHSRGK